MSVICELKKVRQEYSGRTVLELDHLEIEAGSIVGLAGPNGSGKSTLLRLMAFLEEPVAGKVFLEGRQCTGRSNGLRRKVTLMNQEPFLLKRTVFGNVAYGLKVRGVSGIEKRVHQAMEMVGLSPAEFVRRNWFELSGGEAQRVALASRLAIRPKMLLMDEPTASLDEESTRLIRAATLTARDQGTTLVIASHDMDWLREVSDRIIFLKRGRAVESLCEIC